MFFQTMFREKALAQRARRETVDARLQVTAPHEWLLVSGLGVALVVLLAYGLLGRAERSLPSRRCWSGPGSASTWCPAYPAWSSTCSRRSATR